MTDLSHVAARAAWDRLLGEGRLFAACSSALRREDGAAEVDVEIGEAEWVEALRRADPKAVPTGGQLSSLAADGAVALADLCRAALSYETSPDLERALTHWSAVNLVDAADAVAFPDVLLPRAGPRARSLLHRLAVRDDNGAALAALFLLALDGSWPAAAQTVDLPVLFDLRTEGGTGTLRLARLQEGPAGLFPDPASMFCFAGDERFASSLRTAWSQAGERVSSACVTWSLRGDDGPVTWVDGPSLGAAVALGLDELEPRRHRWAALHPLRIDRRCAVTAELREDGTLGGVGGLRNKLDAAAEEGLRVVLAEDNRAGYDRAQSGIDPRKVGFARDRRQAFRKTRTQPNERFLFSALVVFLVIASVTALVVQQTDARRRTREVELQELAARLINDADLVDDDDPRLAQLLALHSYELNASERAAEYMFDRLDDQPYLVGTLEGHEDTVTDTAILADNDHAVSADLAGTVCVWDLPRRELLGSCRQAHHAAINGLAANPVIDQFMTGDDEGRILAWSAAAWPAPVGHALRDRDGAVVNDLAFSFDGSRLAVALSNGDIEVYAVAARRKILDVYLADVVEALEEEPVGIGDNVAAVAFLPDGNLVAASGTTAVHLDLTDQSVTTTTLEGAVNTLAADHPDPSGTGRVWVLAGTDIGLFRWNPVTGEVIEATELPSAVWDVDVSAPGTAVVAAADGSATFDVEAGRVQQELGPATGGAASTSLSNLPLATAAAVVVTASGQDVLLWDPAARGLRNEGIDLEATRLEYLPGGDLLVGTERGELHRIKDPEDEASTREVGTLPVTPPLLDSTTTGGGLIWDVDISGSLLAVGSAAPEEDVPGRIHVLDLTTGAAIDTPRLGEAYSADRGGVRAVRFTHGGDRLITAGYGGKVSSWDTSSWTSKAEVQPAEQVQALDLSPDGRTLAVGAIGSLEDVTATGVLSLLDADTLQPVRDDIDVPAGGVTSLVYGPDGTLYLSTIGGKVFALAPGSGRLTTFVDLRVTDQTVYSLVLSHDGTQLAAVTRTRVHLFDLATGGRRAAPLGAPGQDSWTAAFSPDGDVLAVANIVDDGSDLGDGTDAVIDQWRLDRASWRVVACQRAGRDLTGEEWDQYIGDLVHREPLCAPVLEAQARRRERELTERAAAEEREQTPAPQDLLNKPDGTTPLPAPHGDCTDLAGPGKECGVFGTSPRRAWVIERTPTPDAIGTEEDATVTFRRLDGDRWTETAWSEGQYLVDVRVDSFGIWRPNEVLLTFSSSGSGAINESVVTDGDDNLYQQSTSRGGNLTIEGPALRLGYGVYRGFEADCCPSARASALVTERDGEWTEGKPEVVPRDVAPYLDFEVAPELRLRPDGLADIALGTPFAAAEARISALLPQFGGKPTEPVTRTTLPDGVATTPGIHWTEAPPQVLQESCWPGGLCIYGTEDATFAGWTYAVPTLGYHNPGAYDRLRLTSRDGLFLGAKQSALEESLAAEIRAVDPGLISVTPKGWPTGSVLVSEPSGSTVAIVAGLHRPVMPRLLTPPPVGKTAAQLQLAPEWSTILDVTATSREGRSPRFEQIIAPHQATGIMQFSVQDDAPEGFNDDLTLTNLLWLPPAPAVYHLAIHPCATIDLSTTSTPIRRWHMQPAASITIADLRPNPCD